MNPIAYMLWSIGDIVEIDEQIDWTRQAGFTGVAFHAAPGAPPYWKGVDPAATDAAARQTLRERIADFQFREVHCPFEIDLRTDNLDPQLDLLEPIIDFCGHIGATVATVHADLPDPADVSVATAWRAAMTRIESAAARNNVNIGFEILTQFDQLAAWNLPHVGVTLDVGHMFNAPVFDADWNRSFSRIVKAIAGKLVHLHVHDVTDAHDHCEVGIGHVDWDDLLRGLAEIHYPGGLTLETNPTRVDPAGIRRSREFLLAHQKTVASDQPQ